MLCRLLSSWPCCLALLAALAACSLNPQPEPPMNDRATDASAGFGGGFGQGGSAGVGGGAIQADAAVDSAPPGPDSGCDPCDCNCLAGGECEAGADADAACPCDASTEEAGADTAPDSDPDAVSQD